jgi:hypothetical protein
MKKLLGIILLGLLWSNLSYADCKDDIEISWRKQIYQSYVFEFLNNNNKSIIITEVRLLTAENQTIKTAQPNSSRKVLKPFGRTIAVITTEDVNEKLWKSSDYSCNYK